MTEGTVEGAPHAGCCVEVVAAEGMLHPVPDNGVVPVEGILQLVGMEVEEVAAEGTFHPVPKNEVLVGAGEEGRYTVEADV